MAADFWAGYLSGAIGIVVGNPLDLLKTRLQAGTRTQPSSEATSSSSPPSPSRTASFSNTSPVLNKSHVRYWTEWTRGIAAPILSYGALNALLYMTYNRSLALLETGHLSLDESATERAAAHGLNLWLAGAIGGLATFVVSAPSEVIKCRAQIIQPAQSSWEIATDLWRRRGLSGIYLGASVTSLRDSIGYGFYFWSYELSKRAFRDPSDLSEPSALRVLLCGGFAGVTTWASIFPLDVIKTRLQTHDLLHALPPHQTTVIHESSPLFSRASQARLLSSQSTRPSALEIASHAYRTEGLGVFFRGLGVCSARAFIVNAVQWAIYEWTMKALTR